MGSPHESCSTCQSYQEWQTHGSKGPFMVCKRLPVVVFVWGSDALQGYLRPPPEYCCPLWDDGKGAVKSSWDRIQED